MVDLVKKRGERNLEMVNEGFHALLHRCAWRRNQIVIIDFDRASWNLVQALAKRFRRPKVTRHSKCTYLADNAQRFSEFLHSTEISIITIAILADGNIELDLGKIRVNTRKSTSRIRTSSYLS